VADRFVRRVSSQALEYRAVAFGHQAWLTERSSHRSLTLMAPGHGIQAATQPSRCLDVGRTAHSSRSKAASASRLCSPCFKGLLQKGGIYTVLAMAAKLLTPCQSIISCAWRSCRAPVHSAKRFIRVSPSFPHWSAPKRLASTLRSLDAVSEASVERQITQ